VERLCLLGFTMIAAIGLTIGLTGMTAIIAAPALVLTITAAVTLIEMGIGMVTKAFTGPIPFNDNNGIRFFGKKPIQQHAEELQRYAVVMSM